MRYFQLNLLIHVNFIHSLYAEVHMDPFQLSEVLLVIWFEF